VLVSLSDAVLMQTAPIDRYPGAVPNHHLILRLLTHLTYHGGQIRSMSRSLVE
jgi:hypothetical protein